MSELIYRFISGHCPEHGKESIIRVAFSESVDELMGGLQYQKEECKCALSQDEGCTDPNQCPMFVHAEALAE